MDGSGRAVKISTYSTKYLIDKPLKNYYSAKLHFAGFFFYKMYFLVSSLSRLSPFAPIWAVSAVQRFSALQCVT